MGEVTKNIFRYIPIHRLWEILAKKELVFMRNTKWDDPFEGFLLKEYCRIHQENNFDVFNNNLYFLCCSRSKDKEFFWRTYTPNKDGVRLELSVDKIKENPRIRLKEINYLQRGPIKKILFHLTKLDPTKNTSFSSDYHYVKRHAFKDEEEARFLIVDHESDSDTLKIKFDPLKIIKSICFDPRMDGEVFSKHKEFILHYWPNMKVFHSNLYDNHRAFSEEGKKDKL